MKCFLLTMIAAIILFGCSKDDETKTNYTEKQEKAFALFNGTWADVQFSNLSGGVLAPSMPDPDKIVFKKHNLKPIEVYKEDYMNGKDLLFISHGECVYHQMIYKGAEYELIDCYYEVSKDADYLSLYHKGGEYNNRSFQRYDMSIKSETKINLHDKQLSLPYIFVKQ